MKIIVKVITSIIEQIKKKLISRIGKIKFIHIFELLSKINFFSTNFWKPIKEFICVDAHNFPIEIEFKLSPIKRLVKIDNIINILIIYYRFFFI